MILWITMGAKAFVAIFTGTGGAGKSSMVDELVRRFLIDFPEKRIWKGRTANEAHESKALVPSSLEVDRKL